MATPKLLRLVVADDDSEMRALLASLLRGAGHEVAELSDGRQVLHYIEHVSRGPTSELPAAIVSDIRMPGVDGLELLVAVKRLNLGIHVILMTGYGDPSTHARAQELGAALVLDKPFRFAILRAAVEQLAIAVTGPI